MTRPDPSGVPDRRPPGLPAVEASRAGAKGLGVFALRAIKAGQLIERAPAIVLSVEETSVIRQTLLRKYYFEWKDEGDSALVLGCGFLYNHSFDPNADYFRDYDDREVHFVAVRDIEQGEEVLINYNGYVDDMTAVEFTVLP